MGRQPLVVGGIARHAAAQMVIDAAVADICQGCQNRVAGGVVIIAEIAFPEKGKDGRLRKLGGAPQAAVLRVNGLDQGCRMLVDLGGGYLLGACRRFCLPQSRRDRIGVLVDFLWLFIPDAGYFGKHIAETGPAKFGFGWKIGAAPKWQRFRGEKHGEWPAPLLAQAMERCHIDAVDVRPLFAVDLDVDEARVHQSGGLGVLKAFVGHHMAPVAGRIAHGKQNGPVEFPGFLKGWLAPSVPVYWIVLVL